MMDRSLSLLGAALQFDRTGRFLLAADADGVTIVDAAGGHGEAPVHTLDRTSPRIAHRAITAVAGFDDQIWIVADAVLYRYHVEGRGPSEQLSLPGMGDAVWTPAPCGPAGGVWSSKPALGVVDDLGSLATFSLLDAELIVPFTARRVISVADGRIRMPSGIMTELAPGSRVLGGQVLLDGRWVVFVIAHGGRRELAVASLGTGQVAARVTVAPGPVTIAIDRGIAAIRVEPDRVAIVNARVGRYLGSFAIDPEVEDLALDPAGERLAIRAGHEVRLLALSKLLPRGRAAAAAAMPPAGIEPPPRLAGGSGPSIDLSAIERAQLGEPEPRDADAAGSRAQELEPRDADAADSRTQPPAPPPGASVDPAFVAAAQERAAIAADARELEHALAWPLLALAPRLDVPSVSREDAVLWLARERALALARASVGIAAGWDSRRLGYANESAHPFELEVAALVGVGRDHARAELEDARRRLAEARATRDAERERGFDASPLGQLARELRLSALEVDILLTVAAPTLWGETARLYAVLANDPGRGVVDEMLVGQLLDDASRYEIAAALTPEATLRRHGLVVATHRPRPFAHLAIDPIVAARLCGERPPVPDQVRVRDAGPQLAELIVPVGELARLVRALAEPSSRPARVVVRGRPGSGRRSLLAALCARAGRAIGVFDLEQLPTTDPASALRAVLRATSLCGHIPCLVGSVAADANARAIADAIARHPGCVVAALTEDQPAAMFGEHVELALPRLTAGQRFDHWSRTLTRHGVHVDDVEALSARYRLPPGSVERAVAHVAGLADGRDRASDATRPLEETIRQARDARLARLAARVTRLPRWSDVVLPPEVLDSLRELIGRVRHGRRVYEDWGFDAVMTTGRGLTALFDGRPGTGKTMVAGIVARELGLDLYRVDVSRLVSKWIGETEKNLAEIFDAADDGQVIVLFDEADSLFARRTEVKSSNDRYANLEVNYLLQRIDSFDGIAILTTNFGSAIDPAFRRRVSFRLSFPFPDEEAREQLWRVHLPARLPIEGELDLKTLARRFQLAGGYIRNACLRAAFLAAQAETSLGQHHLERAVELEYQQVGKISTSGPVE